MRKRSGIEVLSLYPFMFTSDFFVGDNSHTLFIGISQEEAALVHLMP
ncbi:hypothetical protein SDC49_11105 [Lactobacillus sp. R2/2]|nr:hypothetical protein [Lactobacillus sp. R2/2]